VTCGAALPGIASWAATRCFTIWVSWLFTNGMSTQEIAIITGTTSTGIRIQRRVISWRVLPWRRAE
jgi:hypothetical protein